MVIKRKEIIILRIWHVINLIKTYGEDITLKDLLIKIRKDKIYLCPKCNGSGILKIRYNAYPSGLPDSGWVDDWKYKDVECDLCKGEGYNSKEFKPKMEQMGWE